jgi:cytoskeleton protein RodZ
MFELGASLRDARLRRSLELEQVEEETRISRRYLRALEEERFELLPGDAYARAFLRSYADFLGLDAKHYVDEYESRFGHPEPAVAARRPRPARLRFPVLSPLALLTVAAAVLIGVLAWQFGGSTSSPRRLTHPRPASPPSRPVTPKPRPAAHAKPTPIPLLSLKAVRGSCWIDAHLDSPTGKGVYIGTLAQGSTLHFSLRHPLWIRLGAPSALEATIAGKPIVGFPTQTANLLITKTGIRPA